MNLALVRASPTCKVTGASKKTPETLTAGDSDFAWSLPRLGSGGFVLELGIASGEQISLVLNGAISLRWSMNGWLFRRFVLEPRTFGVLQADPEPVLGGLSFRKTSVGWKQAQSSVGNMQATLFCHHFTELQHVASED